MALYMETTKISSTKTAAEIQEYLAASGARQILTKYDDDRKITGLSFILHVEGKPVPFTLPVRVDALFTYLQKKAAPRNRTKTAAAHLKQAERRGTLGFRSWVFSIVAENATGSRGCRPASQCKYRFHGSIHARVAL